MRVRSTFDRGVCVLMMMLKNLACNVMLIIVFETHHPRVSRSSKLANGLRAYGVPSKDLTNNKLIMYSTQTVRNSKTKYLINLMVWFFLENLVHSRYIILGMFFYFARQTLCLVQKIIFFHSELFLL